MQFSTLFVTALAAVAYAAPAEKRENKDENKDAAKQQQDAAAKQQQDAAKQQEQLNKLNQGKFGNLDLAYLSVVNNIDLNALAGLGAQQNLNLGAFANIFNQQAFDLNTLLQVQQLVQLQQLQQLGLLGGVNLAALQLQSLNLGVINNLGGINLQQFINAGVKNQVQAVVSGANVIVISQ
ncbi:hypothetical protein PG990_009367 [Apiospora arundinis]